MEPSAAPTTPGRAVLPWMDVLGQSAILNAIQNFLSCEMCYPDCYVCKRLEIVYSQEFARGLLMCCADLAGQDDHVGCCHQCGQLLPVQPRVHHRLANCRNYFRSLLETVHVLRKGMDISAVLKVRRAVRAFGQLFGRDQRRVYLNHMFLLERRCVVEDFDEPFDFDIDVFDIDETPWRLTTFSLANVLQ